MQEVKLKSGWKGRTAWIAWSQQEVTQICPESPEVQSSMFNLRASNLQETLNQMM